MAQKTSHALTEQAICLLKPERAIIQNLDDPQNDRHHQAAILVMAGIEFEG